MEREEKPKLDILDCFGVQTAIYQCVHCHVHRQFILNNKSSLAVVGRSFKRNKLSPERKPTPDFLIGFAAKGALTK